MAATSAEHAAATAVLIVKRRLRRCARVAEVCTASGSSWFGRLSYIVSTASPDGRLMGDSEMDDAEGFVRRTAAMAGGDVMARMSRAAARAAFIFSEVSKRSFGSNS